MCNGALTWDCGSIKTAATRPFKKPFGFSVEFVDRNFDCRQTCLRFLLNLGP